MEKFLTDLVDNNYTQPGGDLFTSLINTHKPYEKEGEANDLGGTTGRPSISEQVSTRILSMIKSGNLKAGDKLPTEKQMCVALGISRPPLREALKALTLMRIL